MAKNLNIVMISDTHGLHDSLEVPEGDILIHAGDLTRTGALEQVRGFNAFIASLPHKHKIVIAGNHDFCFQREPSRARELLENCIYLEDQAVEVEGIRIYGSPWQPWFMDFAFNLPRGEALAEKWSAIPENTDILVTHGPPAGFGDRTKSGEAVGCRDLLERLRVVQPRLHVFGHIHEGYGIYRESGVTYANVSTCDMHYRPVNSPVVYDWFSSR